LIRKTEEDLETAKPQSIQKKSHREITDKLHEDAKRRQKSFILASEKEIMSQEPLICNKLKFANSVSSRYVMNKFVKDFNSSIQQVTMFGKGRVAKRLDYN
jgi:hypothetical protein